MTYWLQKWQESAFNVYMDKYGIDAGIAVMQEFEKHGSLGKAMIDITKQIKAEKPVCPECRSTKIEDKKHWTGERTIIWTRCITCGLKFNENGGLKP